MVCLYCGSSTQVTNSRLQRRANTVWRRRQCMHCSSVFTTNEAADLSGSLAVAMSHKYVAPFDRDKLFLSILASCKHREAAIQDARALTQTIISQLVPAAEHGRLSPNTIITIAQEALSRFDKTAATVYGAFHKAS